MQHSGLMCQVDRIEYDFEARKSTIHMPEGNCTDMAGAIALFVQIDKSVGRIETYEAGRPDTFYSRVGEEWAATLPEER